MKVGICRNHMLEPHVAAGIRAAGDQLVDYADTGCDAYIAWGWPMCQEVDRCIRAIRGKNMPPIICVDRGMIDPTKRIYAINGWGALAEYSTPREVEWLDVPNRADPAGPLLIIGQVRREQKRCGEVDQWDSPGYEQWVDQELKKPNRKFRPHPRCLRDAHEREIKKKGIVPNILMRDFKLGEKKPRPPKQSTLDEDLKGCSGAIGWNSTAIIHAAMLGYPVEAIEAHSMIRRFTPRQIAGLEWSLDECADGSAWRAISSKGA